MRTTDGQECLHGVRSDTAGSGCRALVLSGLYIAGRDMYWARAGTYDPIRVTSRIRRCTCAQGPQLLLAVIHTHYSRHLMDADECEYLRQFTLLSIARRLIMSIADD
ncbi:hypothetical protein KIN20_011094 [Parelaphostrongylus tenuis]|uniref:Uncharacterized protein n=1 Tax=Parelaphostrongylus tenuis TaxID=148309 RepID=A0AAD5QLT2_PARTN|nr:hypothetical protein KIN20_011094 [Parelaphostrongylus tenuis]